LFEPFLFSHPLDSLSDDKTLVSGPRRGEGIQEPRRSFIDGDLNLFHALNLHDLS